jgi:hypothetical protein
MTEGAQPGGPGSVVGFMQELVAIFTGESTRAASRLCLGNGYSEKQKYDLCFMGLYVRGPCMSILWALFEDKQRNECKP